MNKSSVVLFGVMAGALGASIACNCILNERVCRMEELLRRDARKTAVRNSREVPKPAEKKAAEKEKSGKSKFRAELPATPILFKSAVWRDGAVVLDFESDSRFVSGSFRVSPDVPVKAGFSGKKIVLAGSFLPGMKYRITIPKGAKNASGGMLENDAVAEIKIPDREPEVSFATSGTYLPLNGKKLVLPFRSVNCSKVKVVVYKAFENNLNPYVIGSRVGDERMIRVAEKTLELETPKNREVFHELDLEPLTGGRKPGVYRVTLNGVEQYVFITDMALQVVEDVRAGRLAVFARSLATGKPVVGAELAVMSFKNQLAASGRTDENGGALLSYDPAWDAEDDRTVAVVARKDGDISYFLLKNARLFDRTGDAVSSGPRAFVFAERGIARPGEKITASVFLRRDQNGTFKPMKDSALEIRLLDPTGARMFSRSDKSDRNGFFQTGFTLPETAATGVYSIVCLAAGSQTPCGRTAVRVASYVPDRIRVSGRDLSEKSGIEDMLEFEFDAKYYFGAPLENGSWQYSVRSFPGAFPAHWEKSWSAGDTAGFVAAEVLTGKGKKGKDPVKFQYPGFRPQNGMSFSPVRIEAVFEVSEPGGRAVTGRVSKQLYPTPFFIGLRETESKGREKRFEYTLLPAEKCDELSLSGAFAVTFELARKEWEYVLSRDGEKWKREWVRRVIPLPDRKKTASLPAGKFAVGRAAAVSWNDLPSGEYTLTARSGENYLTKLDFSWYAGEGGERSANPNSLYFRTDAEEVSPGGTLTFSFDAPGDGEAFLVYGERTLSGRRTAAVKTGKNTVTVKVPQNIHSSSYFVGCTVVTRRGGNWLRNFGLLKVKVDQTRNHRLSVALEHHEKAEPGEELAVKVALRDSFGKPRSGAVCLYAVDSGVISLTDYRTPDIFGCFYGGIACPMEFYDMYGMLFEDLRITPDGRIGGDAAAMGRKLGKIKQKHTVRLIVPLIEVPASGRAEVKVRLPDHTGELTFFAVASSDDAAGSVSSPVVMRKPVTVQIAAPRFIAPGDTAELAVTVFNHEAGMKDFSCTVALPPMLKLLPGASSTFAVKDLGKGKQRTYTLKVRAAGEFGSGPISAVLAAGQVGAKDETSVTVRSVNVSQGAYRFVLLKPGESFKAEVSGDYIGEVTGSIRLSASPALAVKNALDWLNGYPHGCLEQTTAGAFPFLSLPALAKVGLIDEAMAKTNSHKPAAAYAKMLAMALSDGSFAMWPGGSQSWNEATVFALHFIFEAEKRGQLSLDGGRRRRYISWLRRQVNDADPGKRTLRAWCAYVLAVGGDRAFVTASRNIIEGSEKPDYALLLAGGALVKGGYASLGAPAMRQALAGRCWTEESVPTAYSDKACRLGMALYVLMDCALPEEELATRLALELAESIRPDGSAWGTTQANAWAALGLAAYAEKYPPLPAQARITVKGKSEEKTFSGAVTLPAVDGVSAVNTSRGTLIAESGIQGIPRKTPPSGGAVRIFREYLNEKGEPVTSVRHGDKVRVRIRFETPVAIESMVIADLLPAGLEIEDELLASRAATLPDTGSARYGAFRPKRLEKRDDRFVAFGDTDRGRGEITYQTRAVIRGSFVIPPVHAEAMYQPDTRGVFSTADAFTVK